MRQEIDSKDVREHKESESSENIYVGPSMRCYVIAVAGKANRKGFTERMEMERLRPSEPRSTAQASTARSVVLRVQSLHREEHQALIHVGW